MIGCSVTTILSKSIRQRICRPTRHGTPPTASRSAPLYVLQAEEEEEAVVVVVVAAAAAVAAAAVLAVAHLRGLHVPLVRRLPTSPCKHVLIVSGGCENTETNGVNIIAAENRARSGVAPIESL